MFWYTYSLTHTVCIQYKTSDVGVNNIFLFFYFVCVFLLIFSVVLMFPCKYVGIRLPDFCFVSFLLFLVCIRKNKESFKDFKFVHWIAKREREKKKKFLSAYFIIHFKIFFQVVFAFCISFFPFVLMRFNIFSLVLWPLLLVRPFKGWLVTVPVLLVWFSFFSVNFLRK